ncbi:MAG: nucleotide exchange factor GrpE [Candidatus Izemoplasmatales bacterium]
MSEVEKELVVEEEKEIKEIEDTTKDEKTKKKKKNKFEDQLEILEEELKTVKDKYFRALAEMENYKKRMSEDLKRERKYAGMPLADKLIDAIEVFDLALKMETEDENLKNFLYGFNMINDMMFQALKDEGVLLIESKVGDDFDPTIHEAVDKEHNLEVKDNSITKIVKKGYKFKDRILRPTMVIINIKPEETKIDENIETIQE